MSTQLAKPDTTIDPSVAEAVLLRGDLKQLSPQQKISFYKSVCDSLGLNPLTQPFAYIILNGKETLYAKREATEQLRNVHNISIEIKAREVIEGCYVVTASASMPSGRRDESTGAVSIEGLKGEARANALLKAETKAKRRVTLSICGLGMLDETEIETIPSAHPPSDSPVTTRPVTFTRKPELEPVKTATAAVKEALIETQRPVEVETVKPLAKPGKEPKTLTPEQQLHRRFREELNPRYHTFADQLLEDWLIVYMPETGGHVSKIPQEQFIQTGKAAMEYARSYEGSS